MCLLPMVCLVTTCATTPAFWALHLMPLYAGFSFLGRMHTTREGLLALRVHTLSVSVTKFLVFLESTATHSGSGMSRPILGNMETTFS